MNGDGRRDVGLAEADAVAQHGPAVLLELCDQALCGLALVSGRLVALGRRMQRSRLPDHAPDVIVQDEPRLLTRVALFKRTDAANRPSEVGLEKLARLSVPLAMGRRRNGGLRIPVTPRVARANVAELEVRAEVQQHVGNQRGGLLTINGDDNAVCLGHNARDGICFRRRHERALRRGALVDEGPSKRDFEVLRQVSMELRQQLSRAACECVVLLPPTGLWLEELWQR